ncbi:MAG: M23 family metallopeptidase [Cellvibrionaceae bacterium]
MKIIVVSKYHGRVRHLTFGGWTRALLSICVLGLPLGIGLYLGHKMSAGETGSDLLTADTAEKWSEQLAEQKQQVNVAKKEASNQLNAITLRMAALQARLVRLDALGERLTTMAKLDNGEFDFNQPPAVGGPETTALGDAYQAPEFIRAVDQLSQQIDDREQQLDTLEALMAERKLQDDVFVAGRPVKKGWMSSRYGRRTDPFNGSISWHSGVDFAGKLESDIIAVAAGVVVESGERSGYGGFVEINHGGGFKTRYAHNKQNLVKTGDVVKKGQVIALMGSSGRSTGPHVHFEVYKYGRPVDPATYIHRTHR